eukprot:scaffold565476_cov212-Attheya_sp.AAC.1
MERHVREGRDLHEPSSIHRKRVVSIGWRWLLLQYDESRGSIILADMGRRYRRALSNFSPWRRKESIGWHVCEK